MNYDKYKEHLISTWQPEYEHLHTTRDLMVAGWNMLLDEFCSPVIEKELGMHYLGKRIWADDYNGHRRRVLTLFQGTDLGGSFQWGWNFDFVPKMSGGKAVYARTDKTIATHIFENVHDNHIPLPEFNKKEGMFFDRCSIDTADFENSMEKKIKEHIDAFYLTLPLIKMFYDETETYEDTIEMIDTLLDSIYYRLIQGSSLAFTKIFLKQYLEPSEENEKALRNFFSNEATAESAFKKLAQVPQK